MPLSLFAFPAALWAASIAAAMISLLWCRHGASYPQRSLVFSVVSTAIAVFGLARIHLSASKTVNDKVEWAINSKWFFLVALALGCVALAMALKRNLSDKGENPPSQKPS